ncbi:GNAT family N-acetyltransferase [Rhizomonospora bruguierae]|uniref:GNAT family N-acetyltransferase n=1 Tax=Rhizomonospora bruguierae TaxID=1581705 RepID=UPI001BCAB26B|nr:GNAT family N-acetyltransferase [Micromonospora sp. NBRC 107566]
MSVRFELGAVARTEWDALTGPNFYSSANWLDFCAVEHGAAVDAVVAAGDGTAAEVAIPLFRGADLAGSPYDWNAQLASRNLPTLPAGGLLAGPREGYQTHLLRATPRPAPGAVTNLLTDLRARAGQAPCVAMFLNTEDVRLFHAAGVPAPAVLLECDAWLPVPAGGFDTWFAALSQKRRGSVRKEMAAFTAAGYRIHHLPLRECSTLIAPLAVRTEAKYGYEAETAEDLASFRNHEHCLGDAAMVALCTLDDSPVGFCLYYVWGDTVFLRWAGFDYSRLRNAYEYFNLLYYEQLRWAAERNIRWIHAGIKAMKAKVLRGAIIRPLWLLDLTATSPLRGAAQAVHDHNAAFLDKLLADSALASGIADREEWA